MANLSAHNGGREGWERQVAIGQGLVVCEWVSVELVGIKLVEVGLIVAAQASLLCLTSVFIRR